MKKIVKKNQIIITVLAVMIAVAGYLSFTSKEVSIIDENGNPVDLASGEAVQETLQADGNPDDAAAGEAEGATGNSDDAQVSAPLNDSIGEAVLTNAETANATAAAIVNAKLNREQNRAKEQELLMQIVNNEELAQEAKQEAVDTLVAMTAIMEKESICEQQLMAKGFEDCVVLISEDCVDIVTRKAGCDVSQIVITSVDES